MLVAPSIPSRFLTTATKLVGMSVRQPHVRIESKFEYAPFRNVENTLRDTTDSDAACTSRATKELFEYSSRYLGIHQT